MSDFTRDFDKATRGLADAIDRFDRGITRAASKPMLRRRTGGRLMPARLAPPHRPTRHPVTAPIAYRRQAAPTALDHLRAREDRLRGGPNPIVAAVRRTAARIRDAVRRSLGAVRRGLQRIGGRARRAY